jgi:hypothetical protein
MRRLTGRIPDLDMLEPIANAAYPPGVEPERGPVHVHEAMHGVVVEVLAATVTGDVDPAVRELFERGGSWFPTAHHWFRFCAGPLAAAFDRPARTVRTRPVPRRAVAQLRIGGVDRLGVASARRQALTGERIAGHLGRTVFGQEAALQRIGVVVATHVAKRAPARPAVVMLLGPTGVGKTSSVLALPATVHALAGRRLLVHRVDCNELTESIQVTRLIGTSPGYVGFTDRPPLIRALRRPGCVLLLDEIEKAHRSVFERVLLNLIDAGRITAANGKQVDARGAIICLTSNLGAAGLAARLETIGDADRFARERACQDHLLGAGLPPELVGRIGAFAVFGPLDTAAREQAAYRALHELAAEFGIRLVDIAEPIAGAICDVADASGLGARALVHAARDLAGEALAALVPEGVTVARLLAGPPVQAVSAVTLHDGRR